jgi:prolyl oligopeptidase
MKIKTLHRAILLSLTGLITLGAAYAADPGAPVSEQHAVSDVHHNVTVTDPYRWLENTADPKVHAWSAAQDARTRKYLAGHEAAAETA